jgi:fucose permease
LWLGLTTGRVVLGFVTGRFKSLKKVVAVYMMGGMTCQLIFWLFTGSNMIGAGISMFTLGIFIGPFYPSAMIMATKILPKKLHVPGICAANALAGIGATGLPVLMGTSIEYFGAYTLQPIVTIFFVVLLILWSCLPTKKRYT